MIGRRTAADKQAALEVVQHSPRDTRYTLGPAGGDLVYIEYTNGVRIRETPSVAERALESGIAKKVPAKKIQIKR